MKGREGLYYGDYLCLDQILGAQHLESAKDGTPAHDEMLFIIVHQAYELWFKQILFELDSVMDVFDNERVEDREMGQIIHRLSRIKTIQRILVQQIDVIETMTPLDFLEFRDLLVPASGFQSLQFKEIEIRLGIKREMRIRPDREFFHSRLRDEDRQKLEAFEKQPSLLELTDAWLARMPFLEFGKFQFWTVYADAVNRMLDSDLQIVDHNPTLTDREREFQREEIANTRARFQSLLDEQEYRRLRESGEFRFSHDAFLAALFIHLYRDEPMLYLGYRYLALLVEIDELFTTWRQRHAIMVQRMLGTKIGTGGSAGHDYLIRTMKQNRIFLDLFNLSTYLIPRSDLPVLPPELNQALGFFFSGSPDS